MLIDRTNFKNFKNPYNINIKVIQNKYFLLHFVAYIYQRIHSIKHFYFFDKFIYKHNDNHKINAYKANHLTKRQ